MTIKRVTLPLLLVADALLRDPGAEHYGYGVAKATGLLAGTVQPILARLESEGWLTSRREQIDPHEEGRRPRRLYKFTAEGQRAAEDLLEERRAHLPSPSIPASILGLR